MDSDKVFSCLADIYGHWIEKTLNGEVQYIDSMPLICARGYKAGGEMLFNDNQTHSTICATSLQEVVTKVNSKRLDALRYKIRKGKSE